MGKKKKLKKKIKELDRMFYDNNKYVSREEFLCSRLSKPLKRYYEKISEERKKSLLEYIIKQEDFEAMRSLERIEVDDDQDDDIEIRRCRTITEVIEELKRYKKRKKKKKLKYKNVIKGTKGLLYLLNPEAYDLTLLSKKEYREYLKKLAEEEMKENPIELDCTLKNFHKELMKNESVNKEVMESFWNKFGY